MLLNLFISWPVKIYRNRWLQCKNVRVGWTVSSFQHRLSELCPVSSVVLNIYSALLSHNSIRDLKELLFLYSVIKKTSLKYIFSRHSWKCIPDMILIKFALFTVFLRTGYQTSPVLSTEDDCSTIAQFSIFYARMCGISAIPKAQDLFYHLIPLPPPPLQIDLSFLSLYSNLTTFLCNTILYFRCINLLKPKVWS